MGNTLGPLIKEHPIKAGILSPFIFNSLLWGVAMLKKDNSIVDIGWGILFIIPNFLILKATGNWNRKSILTFSLISLWGLRLAYHIGNRHPGVEDFRY